MNQPAQTGDGSAAAGSERAAELVGNARMTGEGVRPAGLPIFYHRPRPLNPERDRDLSLRPVDSYEFARATNSIILGAAEFPMAMRSYPIVFTATAPRAAIAVLGIRDNENLFVGADGSWRPGAYVPAYVRRYPFICFERPERNEMVLCIDEGAGLLTRSAERALFEGDAPTQLVRDALSFCQEFNRQTTASAAFAAALDEAGLLVTNQARVELGSGQQLTLRGFEVIDETKFNTLPDEIFLDWRRRGWLPLVYCQLLSMANWRRLAALASNPA